jgi:hypothetical protein
VLVPVLDAPLFTTIGGAGLSAIGSGLDVAVDRGQLRATPNLPADANFRAARADPAEARRLAAPLAAAAAARPTRVLLREADRPLFEALARQLRETTGIA